MEKKKKEKDHSLRDYIWGEVVGHFLWSLFSAPFRLIFNLFKHY